MRMMIPSTGYTGYRSTEGLWFLLIPIDSWCLHGKSSLFHKVDHRTKLAIYTLATSQITRGIQRVAPDSIKPRMLHNPALLLVGGQALESQGIIDTWAAEVSAMQALATAASTTTASNKHKGVKTGLKWFIYQGYMCKICIYIYTTGLNQTCLNLPKHPVPCDTAIFVPHIPQHPTTRGQAAHVGSGTKAIEGSPNEHHIPRQHWCQDKGEEGDLRMSKTAEFIPTQTVLVRLDHPKSMGKHI